MDDDSLPPVYTNALDDAREAIRRAFEAGDLDDDAATISLLAITLGTRRMHRTGSSDPPPATPAHPAEPD